MSKINVRSGAFLGLTLLSLSMISGCVNPTTSSSNALSSSGSGISETPSSSEATTSYVVGEWTSPTWPTSEVASYFGNDVTAVVPAYESTHSFTYGIRKVETIYNFYIFTETDGVESEDYYNAQLIAAGWTIDASNYATQGYLAVDSDSQIEIQYSWSTGVLNWSLYESAGNVVPGGSNLSTSWPSLPISMFLGAGITTTVLSYTSSADYYFGLGHDEVENYFYVYTGVAPEIDCETIYAGDLTTAGWTVDNSQYATRGLIAHDINHQVQVRFLAIEGDLRIYISKIV